MVFDVRFLGKVLLGLNAQEDQLNGVTLKRREALEKALIACVDPVDWSSSEKLVLAAVDAAIAKSSIVLGTLLSASQSTRTKLSRPVRRRRRKGITGFFFFFLWATCTVASNDLGLSLGPRWSAWLLFVFPYLSAQSLTEGFKASSLLPLAPVAPRFQLLPAPLPSTYQRRAMTPKAALQTLETETGGLVKASQIGAGSATTEETDMVAIASNLASNLGRFSTKFFSGLSGDQAS